MTKHLALALLVLAACKGKDKEPTKSDPAAAPSPAAKPAEPAAAPAAAPAPTPAPAPAATDVKAALSYGDSSKAVQCAGFTATGAYVFTESMDNGLHYLELAPLGDAEDPQLSWDQPDDMRGDPAKVAAATAPVLAKMNAFVADKKLAPCAPFAGKLGGKDAAVTAQDDTVTLTVGGKKITRTVAAGGSLFLDKAEMFTNADSTALVVGVNVGAEAMSKYVAVYFGPADLK